MFAPFEKTRDTHGADCSCHTCQLDDANHEIKRLRAEVELRHKSQGYRYVGKDGKPILARDLEDGRDEWKARAEKAEAEHKRLHDAASELLEVANLRGDNDLPHPADDPKLWSGRMQDAWHGIAEALAETETEPEPKRECGTCRYNGTAPFYMAMPQCVKCGPNFLMWQPKAGA